MKFDGIFDMGIKYNYYEGFDECILYLYIKDKEYGIDIEIDFCKGGDGNWYGNDIKRQMPQPYIDMVEKAINAKLIEY